jgi:hypothetical protein
VLELVRLASALFLLLKIIVELKNGGL